MCHFIEMIATAEAIAFNANLPPREPLDIEAIPSNMAAIKMKTTICHRVSTWRNFERQAAPQMANTEASAMRRGIETVCCTATA